MLSCVRHGQLVAQLLSLLTIVSCMYLTQVVKDKALPIQVALWLSGSHLLSYLHLPGQPVFDTTMCLLMSVPPNNIPMPGPTNAGKHTRRALGSGSCIGDLQTSGTLVAFISQHCTSPASKVRHSLRGIWTDEADSRVSLLIETHAQHAGQTCCLGSSGFKRCNKGL